MKEINLTQGKVALVDDEDYERLNAFKWSANKHRNTYYAVRHLPIINGKRYSTKMHHDIIGKPPKGKVTDHQDNEGLNNQKYNLRFVTNRQNCQNKRNKKMASQYPGVCWAKALNKWKAQIQINGINKYLGYFDSEQEAFQAYKTAVNNIGEQVIRQENIL